MKSFGRKGGRRADRRAREQFELYVELNGEAVRHEFTCEPKMSANDLLNIAQAEANPSQGTRAIRNLIRRCLVDDDGVPATWAADPLTEDPMGDFQGVVSWPASEVATMGELSARSGVGVLPEGDEPADWFQGPDGLLYGIADEQALEKFSAREAGSSRRRWDHLMDRDDESTIEMTDLMEVVRWLTATAGGRPTAR